MSRIHSKDTSIEVKVRKELFARGFRYRKNVKELPGKPDIVLKKYRTAIFINGCYWHRHPDCPLAQMPKERENFWQVKFDRNVANDEKNKTLLESVGWKVIILWECEIKEDFEYVMYRTVQEILDI